MTGSSSGLTDTAATWPNFNWEPQLWTPTGCGTSSSKSLPWIIQMIPFQFTIKSAFYRTFFINLVFWPNCSTSRNFIDVPYNIYKCIRVFCTALEIQNLSIVLSYTIFIQLSDLLLLIEMFQVMNSRGSRRSRSQTLMGQDLISELIDKVLDVIEAEGPGRDVLRPEGQKGNEPQQS